VSSTVILHDAVERRWLKFADPVEVVSVDVAQDVLPALRAIESRVNDEGLYAAGFISYDAAPAFDASLRARSDGAVPLLWFGLFREPEVIAPPPAIEATAPFDWTPSIRRGDFDEAIARVKDHIAEGDSYQVNYTFRLRADVTADPWDVFRQLVQAQPAAYSAFVQTDTLAICSVSPELFFQLRGTTLVSQPMKGTARRGRSSAD